jgi:DNA-binding transcriptional ArsR family regulator
METEEKFLSITSLICEPARAKMLWNLLDGRAYTASELSMVADISATSASNHLNKLLEADIVKVEAQGRHRYYAFSRPEVAYVVESLAHLANHVQPGKEQKQTVTKGIKFCRTCYDHLAGVVGVAITEALEKKDYIRKNEKDYVITKKGWNWFSQLEISESDFIANRRALTRQCLDWSERRPHLAGQLGAILLQKMLERRWFKKVQFSRELIVTSKGFQTLNDLLNISVYS